MASSMTALKPCPTAMLVRTRAPARLGAPKIALRHAVAARRCQRLVTMASPEETLSEVQTIIAEQLGRELTEVKPETKFVDLGADSLDTVEIMMALEEKFGLQLDEEGAEQITTVQQAADLIVSQTQ
mmetsp:Transcript_9608/g.28933  ORF Transcript_9608/g.28933 Transcript_9608/m.28933 type:complete len:127 (-) Transcript_9608:359-739(-)|eukprot:CAMPEP_0206149902 /NCGR_PEP_ID=MMETSP1473-20131121/38018_1 /ASSEMBLY_ACC=CAM_ASM_001109 /TAXON_ID=1461547 /ORGANISM="Stichococcus sp, Strain RCC1054" /LENGTH=126 /DNA_ID=CAMNT_0053547385 /DNA_START=82 /DNA_END=462 /DNA_ORIENTATION=+